MALLIGLRLDFPRGQGSGGVYGSTTIVNENNASENIRCTPIKGDYVKVIQYVVASNRVRNARLASPRSDAPYLKTLTDACGNPQVLKPSLVR